MSTLADTQAALRRAAAVIQRLERRIVEAEDARTEPIAIIGASCRLPGSVTNLDEFWQLLESGRDSLTAIPAERFDLRTVYDADPEASGKSYVRSGAFLDNVDHFDAAFFGLSPRETNWIDPQHRLFVECTWEALERAGISGRVHGAQVGVYLGIGPSDYAHHLSFASAEALEGYLVTGTGSSFSAGRVSYLLGLHGPAVAIDTACSSSLVAIHLACNALRTRDCEVAVAGGVQVLLSPEPFILLSRLRALAPDGRCKTFSNHADGYGRGEGCGVLVLKRLSDAKRSGDPILALIRGSAINHDGASSGFTTPNGRAQKAVIQAALKNAHVEPRDVQYVEAHGTGTALGDPIEVEALAESYGDGRSDALRVGALKANIGHLESAAGVAGVLKILAALHNEALPRSLHAQPLSTHIDWQSMPVEVVLEQEGWPRSGTPRIAGVSAFGMSGTNAHLVLEEAPVVDPTPVAPERSAELIVLTAKTPEALTASAARLREHLERQQELRLGDVAYSLVTTRSLMDHRLTLSVPSREALLEALRGVERGEAPAGAVWGQARQQRGKLAWLLTGQGAQQLGMGRGLYAEWPAFRQALDEVFGLFDAQLERPLREIMWAEAGTADAALLDQTGYTQPALFALEWALAQLWRSWGVEPDLLLGHSIGEITAACIAGVFSLADAVRLVGARARLMQGLSKGGAMVSIAAPESEVSGVVKGYAQTVSLAALNGLSSTVIAGTEADVLAVAQSFSARGAATKRLPVSHAFHSPLMDPMLEDFRRVAQSIEYHAQQIPIVANVSGQLAGREIQQAQYWVRQVRDTVRFSQGLRSLEAAGAKSFLELGPKPTLIGLLPATLEEPALLLPSLRGGRSEPRAVLEALGGWAAQGGSVTWEGVFPSGGRRVELPTYAWQRQRYWIDGVNSSPEQSGEHGRWPLSGSRRELPHDALHHILKVGTQLQSFLGDHVVYGVVVVPGAFFVSALLAAAAERWPDEQLDVENVEFLEALRLEEDQTLDLHLILQPGSDDASMSAEVATHSTRTSAWKTHVRARIALAKDPLGSMPSLSELLPATRPTDPSALLAKLSAVHIDWGPQWYWLTRAWISGASTMVELTPPSGSIAPVAPLHPVLLDNGFASFVLLAPVAGTEDTPRLPFAIRRIRWLKAPTGVVRCSARLTPTSTLNSEVVSLDLAFWDESGDVLAVVEQFSIRQAPKNLFLREQEDPAEHPQCLYRLEWTPSSISETPRNNGGTWLVVGERDSFELKLVAALEASGVRVICVASAEALRSAGNTAPINGVIWLSNSNERAPAAEARRLCIEALAVVQALSSWQAASRLWWVTQGAVAVDVSEDVSPAASALWGLGRTVMMEQPELRCTLVDLDGEATADALLRELIAADDESQVAWRKGRRHVARLVRASSASAVPASDNYQLATQQKGALDSLSLVAAPRRAPGAGEVELRIHASGLNFRDVLNALGMYPGEAGPLGGECSGVVTGVGAGVSSVAVGDWVMGLAPGAFRRYATMDARWVTTVPQGLSFEEAASLPIVFLTAWYALHDLARLKRGERVLIHAAAGGVGMAAVQLAQWIGAEVLATASPSKWDVLRSLGVRQFGSSRDLSFAENFRSLAGGAHVVLNALTGDFIDASLSLLSAGGRFIEMGKADIRDSSEVAAAHPGVSYQAFDLTQVDPNRIAEMLAEVKRGIESGHLKPLPVRTFRITQAEAAFRFMAQARHVGKILLLPPATMFSADGTVLITGGLGALGLAVARRCAERGVEHLVLTGRRGRETPGAAEAVAELEAQGAKVKVASVDVSDREALARVLGAIPAQYPLRGVVHAAGLIDDGLLVEQTPERLSNVLSPKVDGAIHLDELTRGVPLDFFVMFSSVAGTLGSAAQGAYAAGNAFLDALATHRRTLGLPGLSLAWGPWAQSGMAAALDSKLQARFARQGISMLSTSEGLSLFESVLGRSESQLVVVPLDLRRLGKALGSSIPSVWRSLVRSSSLGSPAAGGSWSRELSALAAGARLEAVTEAVRTEVARVLSLPSPTQVPLDRPLQELGLDSLMAVELRNALGRRAGVTLPATLAFDHPTSAAIAKHLLADVLKLTEGKQALPSVAPAGASDEPIAIVGIGCRFPGGVTDPESLWRLLEQGVDAITEVPKDRWDIDEWYDPDPDAAGKMTTRWGGFLRDLDRFEPSFFGISPGEALSIDPQERLLLETTWEALEHAGIRAETLMGSATGVYMGLCGNEYQARVMADAKSIDAYALLGTAHSTIVGRLSYWLGLKGPNLPIDTACSSSLVAVHLACQALRASECQLALAGGANVILNPEGTVYFSRLHAMSPSGRCHTFSADADGYVRSEGAGVVVLERLSDALKHGHRVWSIIRGSAVNQDGRSNGLTAPNGPSQQAVILEALRRGGVEPARVGYVECHGTGTPLGDPIEVQALAAALSEGRLPGRSVWIGSLKSNLGHTEGAAGVGGLIKAALTLRHGRIPQSLHFARPNPHIAWTELPVQVAHESVEWLANGGPRIAGVSSFGISGTNAHVVLEEPPAVELPAAAPVRAAELCMLSARTSEALSSTARLLREHLVAHPELTLGDVAYSLVTTRSLQDQRLSISATSRSGLLDALQQAARGQTPVGVQRGTAVTSSGKLAWLFTGQGAQQLGMGRELYAEWPAFREALDGVCALLDPLLEAPLREVMWAEPGSARAALLDQTGFTQPALFAVEWALACLWRSWGVEPDLVLGHSIGQITAATVAGVLTLTDAVRLVSGRARLMQGLPAGGAMVSLAVAEAEALESIQPFRQTVALAAVNGPASVVIAGKEADVSALAERFESRGVPIKRLSVSHAFHSPLMDPMLAAFRTVAESITYQPARIPLVADTTGVLAGADISTPEYWVRHVRETVRFAPAIEALVRAGADTFLELGPRPTLLGLVAACKPKSAPTLLAALRPSRSEAEAALDALGGWVVRGGLVDWKGVFPSGGRCIPLPT
ncbi:MAG: SDR family NAD(P)-dependent oxidoreductase, partial [Deltaproteobacteria bacterium]